MSDDTTKNEREFEERVAYAIEYYAFRPHGTWEDAARAAIGAVRAWDAEHMQPASHAAEKPSHRSPLRGALEQADAELAAVTAERDKLRAELERDGSELDEVIRKLAEAGVSPEPGVIDMVQKLIDAMILHRTASGLHSVKIDRLTVERDEARAELERATREITYADADAFSEARKRKFERLGTTWLQDDFDALREVFGRVPRESPHAEKPAAKRDAQPAPAPEPEPEPAQHEPTVDAGARKALEALAVALDSGRFAEHELAREIRDALASSEDEGAQ